MAGFQLSINGRFWVSTEALSGMTHTSYEVWWSTPRRLLSDASDESKKWHLQISRPDFQGLMSRNLVPRPGPFAATRRAHGKPEHGNAASRHGQATHDREPDGSAPGGGVSQTA